MDGKFKVEFLEEASEFINNLEDKVREKIIYNVNKARFSNDKELFKKLQGEVWEFRTLYNRTYYRLFAFWDKTAKSETVVISSHGIIKKTDKIPKADIEKTERLRKLYIDLKGGK